MLLLSSTANMYAILISRKHILNVLCDSLVLANNVNNVQIILNYIFHFLVRYQLPFSNEDQEWMVTVEIPKDFSLIFFMHNCCKLPISGTSLLKKVIMMFLQFGFLFCSELVPD